MLTIYKIFLFVILFTHELLSDLSLCLMENITFLVEVLVAGLRFKVSSLFFYNYLINYFDLSS